MTTYLSVGTNQILEDLHQPIKNGKPKPSGGLWATIYDKNYPNYNPWIEFLSITPHVLFYKRSKSNPFLIPAVLITLKDSARIFTLKNNSQLEFLKKYYPTSDNWIDFENLSKDYDGIFIDLASIYHDVDTIDKCQLAEFAVSSLIVFNLDCIKHYQKATVDIEPFDYEYEHEFSIYQIIIEDELQDIMSIDADTEKLINQIKSENPIPPMDEKSFNTKYDELLTNFITTFKEKKASTESPEVLKLLLSRHIFRSI